MSQSLEISPVNKSYIFKTDLSKTINLVRTGTIGDGNCFVHAIFHALDKDDYKRKTNNEKITQVNKFRDLMVNSVTVEDFETLNKGEVTRMMVQKQIHDNLENVISFVKGKTELEVLNDTQKTILNELLGDTLKSEKYVNVPLDIDLISKKVLPRTFKKTTDISKYGDYIIGYMNQYVKMTNQTLRTLSELVHVLTSHSVKESFDIFLSKLKKGSYVDDFTLDYISEKLKVNVYVINSENRLPYLREYKSKFDNNVVVLWINRNHFEVLGELTSVEHSTIDRLFPNDHVFIKNIRDYLSRQEQ